MPSDHPDKALEGGSQATPGAFIDWLVDVVEACDRVLAPHGSMCIELGDTYAGSSAFGGDELRGGIQLTGLNQKRGEVTDIRRSTTGWPLAKSLSLIPELFRLTLVYGTNPLTGRTTERWRLRNVVRWVRPNPPVGALGDKFRPATSELMVFCKSAKRYFDLDAVREPYSERFQRGIDNGEKRGPMTGAAANVQMAVNFPLAMSSDHSGAPPLDWWNIPLLEGEEETRYGPGKRSREGEVGRTSKGSGHGAGRSQADADRLVAALAVKTEHPLGAPPLDWWNIPPGGYEGAHYAVFPPELCIKPIKAMCPEKVCRQCGEPSRRIVTETTRFVIDERQALADEITAKRNQAGISRAEVVAWFPHYKNGESVTAQVSNWELGKNVPSPGDWEILKTRLGVSAAFDDLINGERTWQRTEGLAEYSNDDGRGFEGDRAMGRGGHQGMPRADRIAPSQFSDCGHDDYRPGMVLDPFVGSGTTLMVATGHGRDAIGIDLDARNFDLALERVGPLVLERAET